MNKNNFPKSIEEKIFPKIFNQQTEDLLLRYMPLMEQKEMAEHITINLNSYLTKEEIDHILIQHIGSNQDEKLKTACLNLLIHMAALNINQTIHDSLKKMDGGEDNPYSIFTHPKEFLFRKYLNEQMGVNFNSMNYVDF